VIAHRSGAAWRLAFRDLGKAVEHRIANVPRVIGTRRSVRSNGECVDKCAFQIIWNDATAFWSASTGDLDMVLLCRLFVGQPRHIGLPLGKRLPQWLAHVFKEQQTCKR
jgi:hypothetical protein